MQGNMLHQLFTWLSNCSTFQVGRDAAESLQQAIDRSGLDMRVSVLVGILLISKLAKIGDVCRPHLGFSFSFNCY